MILTPHALMGAAIGANSPNFVIALGLGIVSHYLLDSIAHWDYLPYLDVRNKKFADRISIELVIAFFLVALIVILMPNKLVLLAGVLGGLLPDGFEFLYNRFKWPWLKPLSDWHIRVHSKTRLNLYDGLPSLVLIFCFVVFILIIKS